MVSAAIATCSETISTGGKDDYGCLGEKTKFDQALTATSSDATAKEQERQHCFLTGSMLTVLVFGLVAVYFGRHYVRTLVTYTARLRGWESGLVFLLLFTVVSFPMTFGYILLNVACGYIYGFWAGLMTVVLCVTFGVSVAVLVSRRCFRGRMVARFDSDHLKAIMRVVDGKQGFRVVALTRLTPIPFGLQNGLFALTNISLGKCVSASTIGLIPTQAMNTYMGSTLRSMEEVYSSRTDSYVMLIIQVVITAFLMVYVIRRARHEINKVCALSDTEAGLANGRVLQINPQPLIRSASQGVFSQPNGAPSHYPFRSDLLSANRPKSTKYYEA